MVVLKSTDRYKNLQTLPTLANNSRGGVFLFACEQVYNHDHDKKSLQHRALAQPFRAVLVIVLESIKSRDPDYDQEHRFTEPEHGSGMTKLGLV